MHNKAGFSFRSKTCLGHSQTFPLKIGFFLNTNKQIIPDEPTTARCEKIRIKYKGIKSKWHSSLNSSVTSEVKEDIFHSYMPQRIT